MENSTENLIVIKHATIGDIPQILRIQDDQLLENKNKKLEKEQLEKQGFLVNKIDEATLSKTIKNPGQEFLLVAKNNSGEIQGYILGYDFKYFLANHPEWEKQTGINLQSFPEDKIVYGKHSTSSKPNQGVGTKLEKAFYQEAKQNGYTLLITEICEGPISNNRSKEFHTKNFGLEKIKNYTDKNNFDWGVYKHLL